MPAGTNHAGLAVVEGRLAAIGGYGEATFTPTSDTLRILDLASGEWRAGAPMPTPRGALAVAVLDGRIHAIGGHDGTRSVATHEIYDPATDSWASAAPLAHPRNHHAAAVARRR